MSFEADEEIDVSDSILSATVSEETLSIDSFFVSAEVDSSLETNTDSSLETDTDPSDPEAGSDSSGFTDSTKGLDSSIGSEDSKGSGLKLVSGSGEVSVCSGIKSKTVSISIMSTVISYRNGWEPGQVPQGRRRRLQGQRVLRMLLVSRQFPELFLKPR